jgi:hypothetical protein
MQTTPLWAKALQISKASIEEWLTVAPIEESFTFWCLFTGRLPLSDYFGWAMDHYGLAFLEAEYFKQVPNQQLWKQIHSVANWSPWMLPIEQWDGVVFIACVEPPTDMQWSFPVSFVLADPNMLEHLWQRLHSSSESAATATMTEVVAPEVMAEDEVVVIAEAPVAPRPPTASTAPIVAEITVAKNPAAAKLNVGDAPPPLPPKLKDEDMPLGLSKTTAPSNDGSPAGLNLSGLALPNLPPTPVPLKVDLNIPDSPVPIKIDLSAPPPPAFAITLDMPEATPPPIPTAPIAKRTAATPATAVTGVDTANANVGPVTLSQAPTDIESAKTDDECMAWFFRQARTRYGACLALIFSKNSLVPWKWESTIAVKNPNSVVTFDSPSLFRITARTMRPYHGYVVENPMHQDFFASWGFGKLPVHVTGVPIIIGGTFRGMFVCTSSEPMTNEALEYLERNADKAVVQMEKLGTTFSKKVA